MPINLPVIEVSTPVDKRRLSGFRQTTNYLPQDVYMLFKNVCEAQNLGTQATLVEVTKQWVDFKATQHEPKKSEYRPRKKLDKAGMQQFSFWLPPKLHSHVKMLSALHYMTLTQVYLEAVTLWLNEQIKNNKQCLPCLADMPLEVEETEIELLPPKIIKPHGMWETQRL